ncbi:MAG: DUF4350 domain-containing protein [Planctomycetaceae bacterium]
MLSVRNAVLAAAGLLLVSILSSVLTMFRAPDSDGNGADSYGTRAYGYRALFEVLHELNVPVVRDLAPPQPEVGEFATILFLQPQAAIVATEPAYLAALTEWVHAGGRLVVAPGTDDSLTTEMKLAQFQKKPPTFLEAIGLHGVTVSGGEADSSRFSRRRPSRSQSWDPEIVAGDMLDAFNVQERLLQDVSVQIEGSLKETLHDVTRLTIAADGIATLTCETPPDGSVNRMVGDKSRILAAAFQRGAGELVVIADPLLLTNRLLARSDNSILAAQLLTGRTPVVFDEFYHGLGVRGQPLYLLTHLNYASATVGILLVLLLWTWREAVFPGPPLSDDPVRRRDIGEYIHAMARFFSEGRRGRRRLVEELRHGVIRQLSSQNGLPPETADVSRIAAVISRKAPDKAKLLLKTTESVDAAIRSKRHWSESETLDAMRRITACL